MPLILTRRVGETVNIGENITVTVMDIFNAGGQRATTRLSITAPPEVPVHRAEVTRRIEAGEPQRPKPALGEGEYPFAPVYILTSRVHELHDWLRDTVPINVQALVGNRMLVVVTRDHHLRGMTGFKFYAMPGTDPALIAAANLRPGAQRLTDFQMLEQTLLWRQHCLPGDAEHHPVSHQGA